MNKHKDIKEIINKKFDPISQKIDNLNKKYKENLSKFKCIKQLEFEDFNDLNKELIHQKDWNGKVPIFEPSIIRVGNDMYYFLAETWHEGCMESRDICVTNEDTIREKYKDIMTKESGIGYIDNYDYVSSPLSDFGVTWIARKL